MLAYHNDEKLKQSTIQAMRDDIAAQRLVAGQYWRSDKGCFVGCVIRGEDHMKFETQIGFPVMLARLADRVFEGLPTQQDRITFSIDYLSAPDAGADLKTVGWKFLHWILTEELRVIGKGKTFDNIRKAIAQCADVLIPLTKGEPVDKAAADAATVAAAYAAYAATDAGDAAAYAADYAAAYAAADAAAYAADYAAADSAAYAADYAARASARAAYAAARAANAAAYAAARAAGDAAGDAAYERMAAKLVELMSNG